MTLTTDLILLAGLLLAVSILATAVTPRLGVPLLLVFLLVGMAAGEDGPGGIRFNDYQLANLAGTLALAVILFDGGMRTAYRSLRVALWPSVSLATLGVLITSGLTGAFAMWILDLHWIEGLLIGAIVGSTDAAAVFALLSARAVSLNNRVSATLETESGTNDPMAVFLTLAVLGYLTQPEDHALLDAVWLLIQQMGIGALLGLGGGYALMLALKERGYPAFSLGMAPLAGLEDRRLAPVFARVGALVRGVPDPVSGQPELKATPVGLAPVLGRQAGRLADDDRRPPLADLTRGERGHRAGQLVDHLHQRADDPLDDPAIVRAPHWPVVQRDPVLLAAPTQSLALELRGVVQKQLARLAGHRPVHLDPQPLDPGPLVGDHVRQAQPNRQRRGGLQRDHQTHDGSREDVDRDRHVRPPDRQTVPFIDHDQVHHGVIDLDLLQHAGHRWHPTAG